MSLYRLIICLPGLDSSNNATEEWRKESTPGVTNETLSWCNEIGATVTFIFTGVAVWINSPLWPYSMTFQATLYSNRTTLMSVQDPTAAYEFNGGFTVSSQPIWGATNLTNAPHNLTLHDANSDGGYHDPNVYGFTYTATQPGDETKFSSSSPPDSTTTEDTASHSLPSRRLAIILASVIGGISAIVVAFLLWFFGFRKRSDGYMRGALFDGDVGGVPSPKLFPYIATPSTDSHAETSLSATAEAQISHSDDASATQDVYTFPRAGPSAVDTPPPAYADDEHAEVSSKRF
ncbi:hypothetical protein A0H81_13468 [Grifola frondosa]|uniref:Uncharacterized protein n=1 Tax=Grifola frondosa TaxID=5627 RepID=A0A1C7LQX1_GRIFR|nr:hypothetical protein A0H81_13468 [Grifola frondosa]